MKRPTAARSPAASDCLGSNFCVPRLVLCFRNKLPMAPCCIIDFVPPGVDNRRTIDVGDKGHQALLEFVFGGDADVAQ